MIIEGRESIGGTWDLFRYPGIRSDSDMYTLGFSFAPWLGEKAIADGPSILKYVRDIASKYDIDSKIRFGHMVECAEWDSVSQEWTITCGLKTGGSTRIRCGFLFMCSGYYSYKGGYSPDFPGSDRFKGQVVHPQKWPRELDYAGKRVVVVGSGATAVTIVPEMAKTAAHVTMLQRSPTYIVSLPAVTLSHCASGAGYLSCLRPGATTAFAGGKYCFNTLTSGWRDGNRKRSSKLFLLLHARSYRAVVWMWTSTSRPPIIPGTSGCVWCLTPTCSKHSKTAVPQW